MTSLRFRMLAFGLGLAAMTQHQVALAQAKAEACIAQADLSDAVVYTMPILAQAVQSKCAATLSPNGFMATNSAAFLAPYVAQQSKAWPGAMRMLSQFAGDDKEGAGMIAMLAVLPPDTVRPLVDAIVEQKVAEEIKPTDCARIERGVELMAPLPPENVGGLLTFILDIAKVENPRLCPATR
ncbi:MAG: hypothetical protein ACK4GD_11400 [Sphingomonadaceae bacterium]